MNKPTPIQLGSLVVIALCAALFFFSERSVEEHKKTSPAETAEAGRGAAEQHTIAADAQEEHRPAPQNLPQAVVVRGDAAAEKKDIFEELQVIDNTRTVKSEELEKLEAQIEQLDEMFVWDSDRTTSIVKSVLQMTPETIREYAYLTITKSLTRDSKSREGGMVDLEMATRAIEESVPPDMPEMRDMLKRYIDEFE